MLTRRFDYIVVEGDTLFSIALRFNVPLQTLIELNSIDTPDTIYPGQTVVIPVTEEFYQIAELVKRQCGSQEAQAVSAEIQDVCAQYKRHRVRRGDTLYTLAKENNTTVSNITALNPQVTDPRNLKIGSMLTIPITPAGSFIYVVRPGDTVYSIAKANNVSTETILAYNYIGDGTEIFPGQQLVIVK